MRPISSLQPPSPPTNPFQSAKQSGQTGPTNFVELLGEQVGEVNQMQLTADDKVHALLTGEDVSEAEVLTSVQKADLAFRMLLQVRNKLIEAYREVQQIQI